MRLKYYLRGLGIGMAVTALILGIASTVSNKKNTMTDAEIIARAKELGMTEKTVLSEAVKEESDTEPESQEPETETKAEPKVEPKTDFETEPDIEPEADDETKPDEEALEPKRSEEEPKAADTERMENAEPEADQKSDKKEAAPEEEATPEKEAAEVLEVVVIEIVRGDSSDSVSRKLADMGLVDSAPAYDKYLCTNGYDKKIQTGTYEIQKGATQEEIARIITRS